MSSRKTKRRATAPQVGTWNVLRDFRGREEIILDHKDQKGFMEKGEFEWVLKDQPLSNLVVNQNYLQNFLKPSLLLSRSEQGLRMCVCYKSLALLILPAGVPALRATDPGM